MGGVNSLVPVDARLKRDVDVRYETVTLDDLLVSTLGARLRAGDPGCVPASRPAGSAVSELRCRSRRVSTVSSSNTPAGSAGAIDARDDGAAAAVADVLQRLGMR